MKYQVFITETLQREVFVEADSTEEASCIVEDEYYEQKHILDADDYVGTIFTVEEIDSEKQEESL